VEFCIPRTYMKDVIRNEEEDYLHITILTTTTTTVIVCDHEWVSHTRPIERYCVLSKP